MDQLIHRNQKQQHVDQQECTIFLLFYYCSRRRAFSPQTFVSQDSEDSDSEPSSPFVVMTTPDSGSKIERILGRRVLPNTEEEAFILKHNRLAIVYES